MRRPWILIAVFGLSILFFTNIATKVFDNGTGSYRLENTDHISHWGSAILFYFNGFDVYRLPSSQFCAPSDLSAQNRYAREFVRPDLSCAVPGHMKIPRFLVNWQTRVQNYPPGAFLYSAPEALLHSVFLAPFSLIKKFTLFKHLFAAHCAAAIFLFCLLFTPEADHAESKTSDWKALAWLVLLPLVFIELCFWSIYGIYDPASILFLFLSVYFLRQKKGILSVVSYSIAVFLHYRALWMLPLLGAGLWVTFQQAAKPRLNTLLALRRLTPLLFSCFLLGASAYSLSLALPDIQTYAITNPLHYTFVNAARSSEAWYSLVVCLGVVLLFLGARRLWLPASLCLWQLFMLIQTPDRRPWHGLFILPILAASGSSPKKADRIAGSIAVLFFCLQLDHQVFLHWPWPLSAGYFARLVGWIR